MTIYFKVTFAIWPQAAILNFDGWTCQNTTRCQKWILHAKISRKIGITQLLIQFCFQVTFPIWQPAAILDFGFSQIPPPISRGSRGARFFLNTSKSSNQVSNLTMLSVVTGPPDCTKLNSNKAVIVYGVNNSTKAAIACWDNTSTKAAIVY